jgi:HK97 family phage prohead protease
MAARAHPLRAVGWETKRANLAASQANEAGAFAGYASVFGAVDSTGDVIMPGAFAGSLQKRGVSSVKMLWQHQATEPIGVWTRIVEDRRGLKVEGQLDLSVARARETLSLIRSGAVDGLSIGFKTKRATLDKQNGLRKLLEVDLWEISIVTFPALELARIESAKRRRTAAPVTIDDLMMKLARLKAHRTTENFESKLRLFARTLDQRYSPEQPRVPAGSREGGRWTGGGGGSGASGAGRRAPGNQTALNVDPNVASDANNQIAPAQGRRIITRFPQASASQLDRLESSRSLAIEAEARVREIDPAWKPEPALVDPNNIESRIAANANVTRQANARYFEFLRDKYGDVALPNSGGLAPSTTLTGPKAPVLPRDDVETRRGAERENDSAEIIWLNNHDVEQKPRVAGSKNPDYRIDGELFDNYAPRTDNVRNIWRNVAKKVSDKQADSIVVNLGDSAITLSEMNAQFCGFPISGLSKLWVIDRNGKLFYLK